MALLSLFGMWQPCLFPAWAKKHVSTARVPLTLRVLCSSTVGMLSQKLGVSTSRIKNVIIWGNHSKVFPHLQRSCEPQIGTKKLLYRSSCLNTAHALLCVLQTQYPDVNDGVVLDYPTKGFVTPRMRCYLYMIWVACYFLLPCVRCAVSSRADLRLQFMCRPPLLPSHLSSFCLASVS